MLNIHRHPHAFARLTAIFSAGQDSTVAGLFGPTIHPHFTGAVGNPSSSLPAESVPGADSAKENGMPRSIFAFSLESLAVSCRCGRYALRFITLAPKKLIRTRRASEGSASEPSLARRVSMCK